MMPSVDRHEQPADLGRRVFAYLIDAAIAAGLVLVLGGVFFGIVALNAASSDQRTVAVGLLSAWAAVGAVSLAWAVVYTVMQGGAGSIGQRAVGIRLSAASPPTGGTASIGFWRALLRNIVWAASTAILIGYFTPLFDGSGRRRGWHDLAGGDVVVDRARRGMVASRPHVDALPGSGDAPGGLDAAAAGGPGVHSGGPGVHSRQDAAADAAVISFVPGVTADPAKVRAAATAPFVSAAPPPARQSAATPRAAAGESREGPVATPAVLETVARGGGGGSVDDTRAAPAPWVSLTWDDGTRIAIFGRTVFGRNPAAENDASVVAVRDETLSLSKTHFEVGGDAHGVWIVDRHSTNGSAIVHEGERTALVPEQRMPLRPGDRLEFGDRSALVGGAR